MKLFVCFIGSLAATLAAGATTAPTAAPTTLGSVMVDSSETTGSGSGTRATIAITFTLVVAIVLVLVGVVVAIVVAIMVVKGVKHEEQQTVQTTRTSSLTGEFGVSIFRPSVSVQTLDLAENGVFMQTSCLTSPDAASLGGGIFSAAGATFAVPSIAVALDAAAESERVLTPAGPGTVTERRSDGLVVVTLDWRLAQGQGATVVALPASLSAYGAAEAAAIAEQRSANDALFAASKKPSPTSRNAEKKKSTWTSPARRATEFLVRNSSPSHSTSMLKF